MCPTSGIDSKLMFSRVRFIFYQSIGAYLSLGIVPSRVSFPVTGAVYQSQWMISLISFSFSSVLVRIDRVAGQFRNLLKWDLRLWWFLGVVCTSFLVSDRIHIEKVHKGLFEHQDLGLRKFLICVLWKLEVCARGSISLCLLTGFLQPSSATWCLEQVNGFCGPVIFVCDWDLSWDRDKWLSR